MWSPQQSAALKQAQAWARSRGGPQIMRLFGFAGTGKTTLARELAEGLDGTRFCAPTGKAALVLRKKGCKNARTVHSLIYKAQQDELTGRITYRLDKDSPVLGAPLVIVDESSMVSEELGEDLASFGTKILALGDPAQLPPVGGDGFFTKGTPEIMLTEIHRQAADNPIIAMSMSVRTGGVLVPGEYGTSRVVSRADMSRDEMRQLVLGADQVLCGRNQTRQVFNDRTRDIMGRSSRAPESGDKVICLRNNREKGLLNGGIWTVERSRDGRRSGWVDMRVTTDEDPDITWPLDVSTPMEFFGGRERELNWRLRREADEFTYGYAITVHKSQGSQWDNVLLYDESCVFRDDAARHLYTGITRAADRVTVVID